MKNDRKSHKGCEQCQQNDSDLCEGPPFGPICARGNASDNQVCDPTDTEAANAVFDLFDDCGPPLAGVSALETGLCGLQCSVPGFSTNVPLVFLSPIQERFASMAAVPELNEPRVLPP